MRRTIGNIVIVISIIVMGIAAYFLIDRLMNYKKADNTYDEILDIATEQDPDNKEEFKVDWEKVPGVAGWIRFDKPEVINYPVVKGNDNSYYLHRLFNGEYCYAGSIFINAENNADLKDDNTIIYGHNMMNGSMFGSLKKYKDEDYGNRKFYLYLPDGTKHTYKMLAILNAQDSTDDYKYSFGDIDSFKKHQERLKSKEFYDSGQAVDETRPIVSLSTCSEWGAERGRRVLFVGIEIEVEQIQDPASWYEPIDRNDGISCYAWESQHPEEVYSEFEEEMGDDSGVDEDLQELLDSEDNETVSE